MNNKSKRLSDHQFSGVLFHGVGGVDPMSEELSPSPEFVTAGASGLYTTTRPSDARRWAWSGGVVALKPTRPLRIAGDISHNPELERMRRINQYTNEWTHSGDSAGDWYEGEGFPLTKETRDSARDVSQHLASLGYDGHVDSMAEDSPTSSHYVIYDPKVLKPVRELKRR